jgi:hypothetical protein
MRIHTAKALDNRASVTFPADFSATSTQAKKPYVRVRTYPKDCHYEPVGAVFGLVSVKIPLTVAR